ncbi:stage II sporulation protein D [Bacillus timonensis]|nr:stage II sporulation protein D [Bacillus timonensis]
MKPLKPIIVLVSVLFVVTLMIPTLLVFPFTDKSSGELEEELQVKEVVKNLTFDPSIEIAVYRSTSKKIESTQLEEYIIGVVASEMPAEFELEALKAQALSARTYIVKQLLSETNVSIPEGADVTDTIMHQVYKNREDLKRIWGKDYDWKIQKITEAVHATQGQILTYDGVPITASFFSTSNGYTENSEAYWTNPFPYLKTVESPWDEKSPKFHDQKTFTVAEFEQKLGVKLGKSNTIGTVVSRTPGKRVDTVDINGVKLKGREVREKLDLKSTDFNWERKGDYIVITTKGYGHGVGMSQYGANGMAQEGKTYQEIVSHYYKGVKVSAADTFLNTVTASRN